MPVLKKIFYFIFSLYFFSSCTAGKDRTNIELIQDMMKQPPIKAQEKDGPLGMQTPPEGTRALNKNYYPYAGDLKSAVKNLKNPLKNRYTQEILLLGKRSYQKACIYCHGESGDGNGSMKNLMLVRPQSLLSEKARKMPDAQIYHIIHEGQGMMGAYRLQVRTEKERWALVNYIRNLQKMSFAK